MLKELCPYHKGPVKHTLGECDMLWCLYNKPGPFTEGGNRKAPNTGDDDNNQRGTMDLGEARRVEDRDVDSCMVEDSEHQRRQRRPTGDRGFGRVESRQAAARNGLGF